MLDPLTVAQQVAARLSSVNARIFGIPTLKVWHQGDHVDWEKDDCIIRCTLNNHLIESFKIPETAVAMLSREQLFEEYARPALVQYKARFDEQVKRVMITVPLITKTGQTEKHRAQSKGLHVSVALEFSSLNREYTYTMETLFGAFQV